MTLVAQLKRIEEDPQLSKDGPRPMIVDGSLSEIVSKALNIAYTKRNFTTGDMHYGDNRGDGKPPRGAGGVPNILEPDSPVDRPVRPSLEKQQMHEEESEVIARVLMDAIDKKDEEGKNNVDTDPLYVYCIPSNNEIPDEMNNEIESMMETMVHPEDLIFIYTDDQYAVVDGMKVVDVEQRLVDYEQRGARVFDSLESFASNIVQLRRK